MASLVLGTLAVSALSSGASATAISIAGALGGALGTFLDNSVIFKGLFKQELDLGARIDTVEVQGSSEGAILKRCYGPEARVAGTVTWKGPHAYRTVSQSAGKGTGGGTTTNTREYYVSFAVALCQDIEKTGGRVRRAWYNSVPFYDVSTDVVLSGTDVSAQIFVTIQPGPGATLVTQYEYDLVSASVDMTQFTPGAMMTVSGWGGPAAVNNGTFQILAISNPNRIKLLGTPAQIAASAGPLITLDQDTPDTDPNIAGAVVPHLGGPNEPADGTIVAAEGPNTPGYRGTTYILVENLELSRSGSRVILVVNSLVEASPAGYTLGECIQDIIADAGPVVGLSIDTSTLTELFYGFAISTLDSPAQILTKLLLAYDLAVQPDGGVVRFFKRADAYVETIPIEDFSAFEAGSDSKGRPIAWQDADGKEVFDEVNVSYFDRQNDWQAGTQAAVWQSAISERRNVANIQLPFSMNAQQAKLVATRVLTISQQANRSARFSLPLKYLHLLPGDIVKTTYGGVTYSIALVEVKIGFNGVILLEGVETDIEALQISLTDIETDERTPASSTPSQPAPFQVEIIDIAALSPSEVQTPGVYCAAAHFDRNVTFQGGVLYDSTDGVTFTPVGAIPGETTLGRALTVLGSPTNIETCDSVSTVQIQLTHGALVSITEAELLAGSNQAILGSEVIAFKTVTLLDPVNHIYEIGGTMLRGRLNTEDAVGTHMVNERFVLLNNVNILFVPLPVTARNTVRYYKVVPTGGTPANFAAITKTIQLRNIEPWAPNKYSFSRVALPSPTDPIPPAANGTTVAWQRRHRVPPPYTFLPNAVPVQESVEVYTVEILDIGLTTVLRSFIIGDTSFYYSDSLQSADGLVPGVDGYYLRVAQHSDYIGASPRKGLFLIGPGVNNSDYRIETGDDTDIVLVVSAIVSEEDELPLTTEADSTYIMLQDIPYED